MNNNRFQIEHLEVLRIDSMPLGSILGGSQWSRLADENRWKMPLFPFYCIHCRAHHQLVEHIEQHIHYLLLTVCEIITSTIYGCLYTVYIVWYRCLYECLIQMSKELHCWEKRKREKEFPYILFLSHSKIQFNCRICKYNI